MFSKIRNRLTILYVTVMTIFLLAFIAVSYAGVLWVLHREEQQDIRALAEEEAKEHVAMLKKSEVRVGLKDDDNDNNIGGKIFFYVFNQHGQLVSAEESVEKMRPKVAELISNWQVADGEGKIKKFHLADGERVVVIMCSLPIYDGQQLLGRVYVGEDITSYYELLKTLLIVLVLISILFLLAAAFAGHLLAGRAIIPIKESFARQREFVADASHELRTPLSIVLTSVEAVQTDDDTVLSPFSTQVLDDMKSEVRRMTKMVSDLLTLARADTGISNIMKEKFDLSALTEQMIRSFHPVADEKGVELRLTSENNIMLSADKERVNQLFVILLDNAIKYTSDGSKVDVAIKVIEGSQPSVNIIVQDQGIGISDADKNLIFDRFYRVDKARSREEGGTGIGLSIAKWIVDAHEGTIKVESTPGCGSSFTVNLPN